MNYIYVLWNIVHHNMYHTLYILWPGIVENVSIVYIVRNTHTYVDQMFCFDEKIFYTAHYYNVRDFTILCTFKRSVEKKTILQTVQ